MELPFDPDTDFEVLETLQFEEQQTRDLERRFYTLNQQSDDLIRESLPEGTVYRMHLDTARRQALLATQLLQKAVRYSQAELPKAQRAARLPIETMQPWMIPTVAGRDLIRNTELPSDEHMLVLQPRQQQRARPVNYAQAVVQWLDALKVVVPGENMDLSRLTPPQRVRVQYEGVHIVRTGKVEEAKTVTKETVLLPAFGDIYPAERLPVRGWTLLPFESSADNQDALIDPPSNALWFQKVPVVLTSYRDIFALRPSIAEVLENRPADASKFDAYLAYWGLDVRDIPASVWQQYFPDQPVPAAIEPWSPLQVTVRPPIDASTLVGGYTTHLGALNPYLWLAQQADGGLSAQLLKHLRSLEQLPRMAIRMPVPLKHPELESTQPDACAREMLQSYGHFTRNGLWRPELGACVPVAVAQREQELRFSEGRASKSAAVDELRARLAALQTYLQSAATRQDSSFVAAKRADARATAPSLEQLQITAILADASISEDARLQRLQDALAAADGQQLGNLYFKEGRYLLCEHTLDWLRRGALDADAVFAAWAAEVDGKYVCQSCGEVMGQVVSAEGRDEFGNLMQPMEALEASAASAAPVADPSDAYRELLAGSPEGQLLLQFILSLGLQPDVTWLRDFYAFVLRVNDSIAGNRAAMREVLAVAWMVFAFKMHPMRPRRNLSRVPFSLAGFPRSTTDTDTADAPLVDFVMGCLASIARMDPRNRTRSARNPLYKAVLDQPKNFREKLLAVALRIGRELPPETVLTIADPLMETVVEESVLPGMAPVVGIAGFVYEKPAAPPRRPRQMHQTVVHAADVAAVSDIADEKVQTKRLRALLTDAKPTLPTKSSVRITLKRPDLATTLVELYEYKSTVAVLQAMVRAALGRGAYGWIGSQLGDASDVATVTLKQNELVIQLPELDDIDDSRVVLEDLVRVATAAARLDTRYDIATLCLQHCVDIMQGVFGKQVVADLLKGTVEAATGIYAYTDEQVQDRVQRAKAMERRTVDQRFGSLTDAQRDLEKQLRDMGLLPRSIVDEGDRAAIAAIVDVNADGEGPVSLRGMTDDDYVDDEFVDAVDYEDFQESHEAYD